MVLFVALFFLTNTSIALEKKTDSLAQYNVRFFGAAGDGKNLDTRAIQAAIDACTEAGGGNVILAGGKFLSGTIVLKSNVNLHIVSGSVLLGVKDLNQYPPMVAEFRSYTDNYTDKSLIYAEKQNNISITGRGTIDGQGAYFKGPYKVRPYMIRIIECQNVTVRDVTILNSPMWVQHYLACENVLIDGITVNSLVNGNNDGIDIDCCQKVRISNCNILSGDDAIVLKSTADRPCRYITVTNCVLSSYCNAFKCGTESNGGFQDITISNCVMYDTHLSGIALELVDGGVFDRVNVSNITMNNVKSAIFIRLGNRARPFLSDGPGGSQGDFTPKENAKNPGMGKMKNIIISNVQATGVGPVGCAIAGLPSRPIENVTLENIRITSQGGGKEEHIYRDIPEQEKNYPEFSMFGILPAYGFYCRHVKNISFENLDLNYEQPEKRPAMVFDDVQEIQISDLNAQVENEMPMVLWLNNVKDALIHANRPGKIEGLFLQIDGKNTERISLMNNDFSRVKKIFNKAEDLDQFTVYLENNRLQ
jgi:hypothetical protein